MSVRFLQIHSLTSYPSALLNRDDAGFAKRIPFGGVSRTRVSSQCLKRHWRTYTGSHSLSEMNVPPSVSSRLTFERFVFNPLIEDKVDPTLAEAVTKALMNEVLGESARARAKESDKEKDKETSQGGVRTGQVVVLGRPEIDFVLKVARTVCAKKPDAKKTSEAVKTELGKDGRKNMQALRHSAGLDAALFGRMVTSDILSRSDGAVHVAHAFTVHAEETEADYFSAVDDLLGPGGDEQLGSGHIGSAELTSGLFYGYVAVDLNLLVSNLEADRSLAGEVVERLVHLIATVSPGAKLGSTAPYAYAHLMLAESGNAQPRTLANAFLRPVSDRSDLLESTYHALGRHISDLDTMYGRNGDRKLAAIGPVERLPEAIAGKPIPLAELASWCAERVRG